MRRALTKCEEIDQVVKEVQNSLNLYYDNLDRYNQVTDVGSKIINQIFEVGEIRQDADLLARRIQRYLEAHALE